MTVTNRALRMRPHMAPLEADCCLPSSGTGPPGTSSLHCRFRLRDRLPRVIWEASSHLATATALPSGAQELLRETSAGHCSGPRVTSGWTCRKGSSQQSSRDWRTRKR